MHFLDVPEVCAEYKTILKLLSSLHRPASSRGSLPACAQLATLNSSGVPLHIAAIYCPTAARKCSCAYSCRKLPLFQDREISDREISTN